MIQPLSDDSTNDTVILPRLATCSDSSIDCTLAFDRFLKHCPRIEAPANAIIIDAAGQSGYVYYLVKGSASMLIEDENGHEIILAYLNPGEFFGVVGMFDAGQGNCVSVRARSQCQLARITYKKLRAAARDVPQLLVVMLSQISRRLRLANRKVEELAFHDVFERVTQALLDLCEQPDAQSHPDGVQIHTTRRELGRIAGCCRETASHALRDMEERRTISVSGKTIVIHGVEKLRSANRACTQHAANFASRRPRLSNRKHIQTHPNHGGNGKNRNDVFRPPGFVEAVPVVHSAPPT